jgi:hypothetical protein
MAGSFAEFKIVAEQRAALSVGRSLSKPSGTASVRWPSQAGAIWLKAPDRDKYFNGRAFRMAVVDCHAKWRVCPRCTGVRSEAMCGCSPLGDRITNTVAAGEPVRRQQQTLSDLEHLRQRNSQPV